MDDTRQRIGPAIRQLRQRHGLSLSDLAERTGISVSYLSRLEKGRSVPSFTLLSRLSQELGVDLSFFVTTEQEARAIDRRLEQALGQTDIPNDLWSEFFGLSLEGRKAFVSYLEERLGTTGSEPPASNGSQARPRRRARSQSTD